MSRACENYCIFLLSHKLLSLCMASIINISGVHMSVLSEFTNFNCDFATQKGSLKCCNKCLWINHYLHYCLISLNLMSFRWSSILKIMSVCTSIACCRISGFCLCTHSLHHPWLSTEGSGVSSHPLWSEGVRRIGFVVCCAETRGVHRGPGKLLPGTPLVAGPTGSPPCSVASWVDGCAAPPLRWHLGRCGDAVK